MKKNVNNIISSLGDIKIILYDEKYLEDVKDLLVELEEYILTIDKDNLDQLHSEYRDKMAILDLEEVYKNEGKCYLAIENDKVIGLIMGYVRKYDKYDYLDYKCPRSGEISELIVSKNARSKGIGKILIKKMEEYFKQVNCEYIFISVFAYNESAIKFYDHLGYHPRMLTDIKKIDDDSCKCREFKVESLCNSNNRIFYMGILDNEIIAEATAIISENDLDIKNKDDLVGDSKVYLSAFWTNKEYRNKGYFSKLYKFMENDLKEKGYKILTLGVAPGDVRNMQMYFKWGFINYIRTDYEYYSNGEKLIVNYYKKDV